MTETATEPRRGFRLWAKVLLAVSLTLNLLVAGVIVGAWVDRASERGEHGPRTARPAFDPAMGPFARTLPEPYRGRAYETLNAQAGDARANRAQLATQLSGMLEVLKTEPFDSEALDALLAAQAEGFNSRAMIGRAAVLEQIGAMSPQERAELAERMERGFQRALEREHSGKPSDRR